MYNKIKWRLYQYTVNSFMRNNYFMQLTLLILAII